MSTILVGLITTLLLVIGLVGTILPAIPGLGLIVVGILFYALATHFASISVTTVVVLCVIAVATFIAGYFTSALGAKMSGGGRYSVIGTFIGAVVGLTMGPLGMIMGAVGGAFLGALYESGSVEASFRITGASLIGLLSGAIVQFVVGAGIIIAFLVAVWV